MAKREPESGYGEHGNEKGVRREVPRLENIACSVKSVANRKWSVRTIFYLHFLVCCK